MTLENIYQKCRENGVRVLPYSVVRGIFERFGYTDILGDESIAFSIFKGGAASSACRWVIFYNETLPENKKQECIARELEWVLQQKS